MNKAWTQILTVIDFQEGKNPRFSVMVQNQTNKKKKIQIVAHMTFWNPRGPIIPGGDTWPGVYTGSRNVKIPEFGLSTVEFEWMHSITNQEMHALRNRNNLFFYVRGTIRNMSGPFVVGAAHNYCYVYNAWEEPRPKAIPLFLPCGSIVDPQTEKEKVD